MFSLHKSLNRILLLVVILVVGLDGCAVRKSLDNEDRSRIKSILLSPDNI